MSEHSKEILTFTVENQRFAIRLQAVERVIRAVAVTKLTNSPGFIEGVIDYFGEVIAVVNMRKRFGFPLQELKISNQFLIANTTRRKLALIVDQVENVLLSDSQEIFESKDLDAGSESFTVLRDDNGLILIKDIEKLLSESEEIQLEKLIEASMVPTAGL